MTARWSVVAGLFAVMLPGCGDGPPPGPVPAPPAGAAAIPPPAGIAREPDPPPPAAVTACEGTRDWLARHQAPDGSWSAVGTGCACGSGEGDGRRVGTTAMALLAFQFH